MSSISELGTILGIWAHPDDETFMIGGILAMVADAGQQTICVTATRGEQGGTTGEIRAQELTGALNILGVSQQHYLGYQDGKCAEADETEVVAQLKGLIDQYKPDSIITFAQDGLTGHPDHQAVSHWATQVAVECTLPVYFAVHTQETYDAYLKRADELFNIYFATDNPVFVPEADCDLLIKLESTYVDRKLQALRAMPSQYNAWFEKLSKDQLAVTLGTEALVIPKSVVS